MRTALSSLQPEDMARKRNIVDRTPRITRTLYPSAKTIATFRAMMKARKRWPQIDRVWTAFEQRSGAQAGGLTEREAASRAAWNVLVSAHTEDAMLTAPLTQEFLRNCADELENAKVPPPLGSDPELGWYDERMFRMRDLIRRHRRRLQPSS